MPSSNIPSFEENVKNSFFRVKQHILLLENELKADRGFLIKQNDQIRFLLEEIRLISSERDELKAKLSSLKHESSIGNGGVHSFIHSPFIHSADIHSANKQSDKQSEGPKQESIVSHIPKTDGPIEVFPEDQSFNNNIVLPANQAKFPMGEISPQQSLVIKKETQDESLIEANNRRHNARNTLGLLQGHSSIIGLKSEISSKFSALSRQEFLTFLTVYQLEEEIEHVSYIDISAKLGLTEGCIRSYVSSLIKKGIPLVKLRYNNKVVYMSIPKEFRALNLKRELMALYYKADPTQKTLGEGFH